MAPHDTHRNNGQPAAAPAPVVMVRQAAIATADSAARVWRRQVPAWVVSGGLHAALIAAILLSPGLNPPAESEAAPPEQVLETRIDEPQAEKQNFDTTDIGLDWSKETNYNVERIENVSVPGQVRPDEPVGFAGAPEGPPQTLPPPPGFGGGQGGGLQGDTAGAGALFGDAGGLLGGRNLPGAAFAGRSGATRQKMLQEGGGNAATEAAAARGLKYLQRIQKGDGRWVLDGSHTDDVAATGLALLPFLAAGQAHKPLRGEKESAYAKTVELGLGFLKTKQRPTGRFGARQLYGEAIATMAVCEAYGMTQDPTLKKPAQLALDFLVKAQKSDGGWRYQPGDGQSEEEKRSDTSVTGWCLQALQSGYLAGLAVPRDALNKVGRFLDKVQGQGGAVYGYLGPGGSPSMTAVGLLCRQYLGWGPKNPALVAGVENLKRILPERGKGDIYYYYYATQVVHFFGGDDWGKVWNPRMRELLLETQDRGTSPANGSWPPDGTITGRGGGRLTTTCLSLLTLEVYYRHLPLYKRDGSGLTAVEGF
jgi:hypothetical protein